MYGEVMDNVDLFDEFMKDVQVRMYNGQYYGDLTMLGVVVSLYVFG